MLSSQSEKFPASIRSMVELKDQFGRIAKDMRVSLTDRCNLRCSYCMPAEGLGWLPTPDVLSDDEMCRVLSIAVARLGITKLRFTGGIECSS